MVQYISQNGELLPLEKSVIALGNRAFRYGDGFFETIRVRNGIPLWLEYHLSRIKQSALVLGIDLPLSLTSESLFEHLQDLCKLNQLNTGARIRISVFRGGSGFYLPDSDLGEFVIEASPLPHNDYVSNHYGLQAGFFRDHTKHPSPMAAIKTSSALIYVLAALYGKKKGWDDAIILNSEGKIAEATSSNIFMVSKGKIYTPSLDQGCVDGVMRRVLLDVAKENKMVIRDCVISASDLEKADEVFITNTIKGIQWIKGIDDKRYYHKVSTLLLEKINNKQSEPDK